LVPRACGGFEGIADKETFINPYYEKIYMNSEYVISKDQIKWINRKYGGSLRSDAEIETALHLGKGKSVFRKIAYLWRAILVGHPFTDGNKRTALISALTVLEACEIRTDNKMKESLVSEITKIARENITDVNRTERLVRYAVTGD
jgi:prophage maintenance system killer protein